ncbi:MAG TPA: glucose-6-phosphate isomerase [Armatimonadota bacterium]|nr:glucose-6-phosphate isomerase [Armatimonadota bacterium]HOJ20082.1 glucose-6-phosphate isomerase [Armatimonadota bacterium]HOM82365.1 glucose-6-phosphate isomerase [Armatimonadota bacterium]HPO72916.1 glucose-6-phosphate isomerase [Armatimonadota bacterium]
MPVPVSLNPEYLAPEVTVDEILAEQANVRLWHDKLHDGSGPGAEFRGWLEPDQIVSPDELDRLIATANELRETCDCLVVVGIGGSYLGARAAIEALASPSAPPVLYAGQNLSASYHARLLEALKGKEFALNVISKSGTTTEPAVAFRILREHLEARVGKEAAAKRIVATTDARKGALRALATQQGYRTFVVPDDVGGRFSVLSAVGLLPIAFAGIDVRAMVQGAAACAEACRCTDLMRNPAYLYAVARNRLYRKGFAVEILSSFEPRLHTLAEWWKQLYGESEGKQQMGLFPASADFTTDLHSLGQYIQQGRRILIETFLEIAGGEPEVRVPSDAQDGDGLNFLAGKTLAEINREAYRATALAHREGGVPNQTITLERLDAFSLGALFYFFEKACALSGYLLGVNPFDQPGVEAYKKHMFALLGKPGFEAQTRELRERLETGAASPEIRF